MISKLSRLAYLRTRHAALAGASLSASVSSHYSEPAAIRCSAFAEGAILLSSFDRATLASEMGRKPRAVVFRPSQIALAEFRAQFLADVRELPLRLNA